MSGAADVLADERRCHCCGEPFVRCRETYRGTSAAVDVLANGWSAPYYGVQHYGSAGARSFWATVHDYGDCAQAFVWTPGCGFCPMESDHSSIAEARKHAESQLFVLTNGRIGGAK